MSNLQEAINAVRKDFSKVSILVVGDIMLDRYYFSDVNRISPESPVPIAQVQRVEDRSGGAANVSRNLAQLGAQVSLLTIAGQDEVLHALDGLLRQDGIRLTAVTSLEIQTTLKLRIVAKNHQLLRVDFEEDISSRKDLQQQLLEHFKQIVADYDLVIFSDYAKGVLANIEIMLGLCRQYGIKTLVDPKGSNYSRYCNANIITPNLQELRSAVADFHSEVEMQERVYELLKNLNLSYLLLTKSDKGVELFQLSDDKNSVQSQQFSASAKAVYDVSGAGDTVIAVLGLMLATGVEISTAVFIANIAAGIVVSKFGTATVSIVEIIDEINSVMAK